MIRTVVVRSISSLPVVQLGPYFTYIMPMVEGYAGTLNNVSRSM